MNQPKNVFVSVPREKVFFRGKTAIVDLGDPDELFKMLVLGITHPEQAITTVNEKKVEE